jgi:hypothetical protein
MRIDLVGAAKLLTISAAFAALASCGGGGGGGSAGGPAVPTAAIALTPANAQSVAGGATLAAVQTSGKSNMFVAADLQGPPPQTHVLSRFLQQEIGRVGQILQSPSLIAGVMQTVPCAQSGFIAINSDASSISETFSACSDFPGESINGAITISSIASTPSSFSASVSINLTFSATGSPDLSFSGSFGVSETGIGTNAVTITLSGTDLFLQQGSDTQRLGNFTFSTTIDPTAGTTDSASFTFASTAIGGSVTVTTLTPFQTSPGREFPHTGAIQIVGMNGSTIRVTVNGDETGATPQLTIQLDADGDGIFETTLNKNWSDF